MGLVGGDSLVTAYDNDVRDPLEDRRDVRRRRPNAHHMGCQSPRRRVARALAQGDADHVELLAADAPSDLGGGSLPGIGGDTAHEEKDEWVEIARTLRGTGDDIVLEGLFKPCKGGC